MLPNRKKDDNCEMLNKIMNLLLTSITSLLMRKSGPYGFPDPMANPPPCMNNITGSFSSGLAVSK